MTARAASPLIVGAGVAGLAAGIALAQRGVQPLTLDRAPESSPAGGGLQLGPNAVKVLWALGLRDQLCTLAACPDRIELRQLGTGLLLGQLHLGPRFEARYGAPYCTLLRSDLSAMLLQAHASLGLEVQWERTVQSVAQSHQSVLVETPNEVRYEASAVIGADGLWSACRPAVSAADQPKAAEQIAVRAVLPAPTAEAAFSTKVQVHSAPGRHLVSYPVQAGRAIALVAIVPSREALSPGWGAPLARDRLMEALGPMPLRLSAMVEAAGPWLAWPLWASAPLSSARAQADGRVALIGDAAHPMRPHLAQGAAMGLEDALVLANCWARVGNSSPVQAFADFANLRWRRNARTQSRAIRVGRVFQLGGLLAWARNLALGLLSETLMDQPSLYAYDAREIGQAD